MAHPSKVKGNGFEREIIGILESYGIKCKRAWGSNGQSLGLHEEVDVLAEGDLRIQAKRRKKIAEWLKPSEVVDTVVVREDRGEPYIIIRLEEFADEYKKYLELRKITGEDILDYFERKKNEQL